MSAVEVLLPREESIASVQVRDRHRSTLGDLTLLQESIRQMGLLHPIVVTPDLRLVAGQRRLEACRALGWSTIPVRVIDSLDSARLLLEAERDENICRLDMAPSEKVGLGRALEVWLKPLANANKVATQAKPGQRVGEGKSPPPKSPAKVREVAAAAVGMSGQTYARAKQVVLAAETGDSIAREAVAEMDRTGKVSRAYEKVTGRTVDGRPSKGTNGKVSQAEWPVLSSERDRQRAHAAKRRVETVVGTCQSFAALEELRVEAAVQVGDQDEVAAWDKSIADALRSLRAFHSRLRKASEQHAAA